MAILTDPPGADELEISIFSRGYGECIVVHVGANRWMIIDSHLDADGEPIGISYLQGLGVSVSDCVNAVLLTHWHDDHIGGAAKTVASCPQATVGLSGFLQRDEFGTFLYDRGLPDAGGFGSGVEELSNVLETMAGSGQKRKWCWAEKTIAFDQTAPEYRMEALSPSEKDFEDFIAGIAEIAGGAGRLGTPRRNDSSVASVLSSSNNLMLFGADLEIGRDGTGWRAIHKTVWQSRGKASFYKIAHHGSVGADYEPVWLDMLADDVLVALTPWNRGSKLPTQADVERILNRTGDAYGAAKPKPIRRHKRINAVEKSLRESGIKFLPSDISQGHARFRKKLDGAWIVSVSGAGCHLSQILAA